MTYECDISHCGRTAKWANIGEGGDLYLCSEHFDIEHADGWVPIGPDAAEL